MGESGTQAAPGGGARTSCGCSSPHRAVRCIFASWRGNAGSHLPSLDCPLVRRFPDGLTSHLGAPGPRFAPSRFRSENWRPPACSQAGKTETGDISKPTRPALTLRICSAWWSRWPGLPRWSGERAGCERSKVHGDTGAEWERNKWLSRPPRRQAAICESSYLALKAATRLRLARCLSLFRLAIFTSSFPSLSALPIWRLVTVAAMEPLEIRNEVAP